MQRSSLLLLFFRGVRVWRTMGCHEFVDAWLTDDVTAGFGN